MNQEPETVLPLAPGTQMERYTILSVLGQGACGIAYLVQDADLSRRLLLKEHAPASICKRSLRSGEIQPLPGCEGAYIQSLSSFLQEAAVLSKLRLPTIPEVYEVFEAGGSACTILSYVEGSDLGHWLREQPERRSLLPLVLAEALRTLCKMHRLGVRHRDLKPGHIILDASGAVSFIDFGVAYAAGSEDAAELVPAFTPPYSPPEQGVSQMECAASDLYALAAAFYEVTLGQKPTAAPARLDGAALPLLAEDAGLRSEFPPAYLATLDRALALEPQARFATAEQWLAALTHPEELPQPPPPMRRAAFRWVGCLFALVALVALAWWLLRGGRPAAPLPQPPPVLTVPEPPEPPEPRTAQLEYALQDGVFDSAAMDTTPTWQGVCTRIDLVGAENLTEEYLSPVIALAWQSSRVPTCNPSKLTLVITDAAGQEVARSSGHRYDESSRTLSFDFEINPQKCLYAKPLPSLPKGWHALIRMPLEPATPNTKHNTEKLPKAQRVRMIIKHPQDVKYEVRMTKYEQE